MLLNLSKFKNYFKNLGAKESIAINILNIFIKIVVGLLALGLNLNINKSIFTVGIAI